MPLEVFTMRRQLPESVEPRLLDALEVLEEIKKSSRLPLMEALTLLLLVYI